jgi:hypothetical protein
MTETIEFSDETNAATLKAILAVLKLDGVKEIEINYSGSGDEGQTDHIEMKPSNIVCTKTINIQRRIHYNKPETMTVSVPVREILDEIGWDIVDSSIHTGFHNGDGGGGVIKIDVETGKITLSHYDTIMSTQDCEDIVFALPDA